MRKNTRDRVPLHLCILGSARFCPFNERGSLLESPALLHGMLFYSGVTKRHIKNRLRDMVRHQTLRTYVPSFVRIFLFLFVAGVLGHPHHLIRHGGVTIIVIAVKHRLRRCHLACPCPHHTGSRTQQFGTPERGQIPALTGAVPPRGYLGHTATPAAPDPAIGRPVRPRPASEGVSGRQVLGQFPGDIRVLRVLVKTWLSRSWWLATFFTIQDAIAYLPSQSMLKHKVSLLFCTRGSETDASQQREGCDQPLACVPNINIAIFRRTSRNLMQILYCFESG